MKNLGYEMSHKDMVNPLKKAHLSEDVFFSEYFSEKVSQQTKMSSEIESTLKSLSSRINIPRRSVLTESDDTEKSD